MCRADAGPGMGPAILGTLLVTGGATLIAVPLGVLGAVYLHEYGGNSRFARLVRFMADGDDRRAVDRDGPVHLRHLDAALRLLRIRRRARAGLPDAAGRDRRDRADAEARARTICARHRIALGATKSRTILTVVLPAALPGHRLGRAARGRARRRRDRAAAVHGRRGDDATTRTCSAKRTPRCPRRSSATRTRRSSPRRTAPGAPRSRWCC